MGALQDLAAMSGGTPGIEPGTLHDRAAVLPVALNMFRICFLLFLSLLSFILLNLSLQFGFSM